MNATASDAELGAYVKWLLVCVVGVQPLSLLFNSVLVSK